MHHNDFDGKDSDGLMKLFNSVLGCSFKKGCLIKIVLYGYVLHYSSYCYVLGF